MTAAASTGRPDVSVVIPTRNRRDRLSLTLRSALAQQDVSLEIVVVDDGSTDDTSDVASRAGDARVRVLRNESALGESGARNRGVAEAKGGCVAFLDDDDLWAPEKLSAQLQAMRETGRLWAYTGDVVVDDRLRILHGAPPPCPEDVMMSLPRHNSVPAGASNVIVSAVALAEAGPFDPKLRRTADWDMWLRLARLGPPAWIRRPLVANCLHARNMSRDMAVMFLELEVISRRYGIAVDRARHYRWAAWNARLDGRRWQALRCYAGAIAAGDVRSMGRAAVALARPVPSPARAPDDAWIDEARAWIETLAPVEVSA